VELALFKFATSALSDCSSFLLYRQTVLVVGNRRELDVVEVRLELAAFLGRSLMLEGT